MALSLGNLAVSNRSPATFRPVITSPRFFNTKTTFRPILTSRRFFNTKPLDDTEDNIPTLKRTCPPFIRDLIKNAHCPHRSAAENLSRQLDLMDDQIGVTYTHGSRWSVGDCAEGLFLFRYMKGLHKRDAKEYVPTRDLESLLHLTHFDTPCPNWDVMKDAKKLNQFVESILGMHVISFMHVFCTLRSIPAIYIVVGHEGPDPWDPYGGYVTKICLPRKFYKIKDIYMEKFGDTVMIKIPKKNNKHIHKIKGDFLLFREKKRQ